MAAFFQKLFPHDIGIDLGTANTLVMVLGKGIIIREPTIVAQHKKSKQIVAIGNEAKRMLGRTPASIVTIRPLKDGVISDFDSTQAMLKYFIHEVFATPGNWFSLKGKLLRPRVVIGIPSGVTEVERRAVQNAAVSAGAGKTYLIEEPMAAALGAEIDIEQPDGQMVVDIGGGTTEIAVISLGGVVVGRSIRIAGDEFNEDIINYIRQTYGLSIGERTAEEIKMTIGNVAAPKVKKQHNDITDGEDGVGNQMVIRGRDLNNGLPKQMAISSNDIREATKHSISQIVGAIQDTIEDTPPELLADIGEHGIVLTGGGALLGGLDDLIANKTKLPVIVAADPLTAVVRGCGKVLENIALLDKVKVTGGLS